MKVTLTKEEYENLNKKKEDYIEEIRRKESELRVTALRIATEMSELQNKKFEFERSKMNFEFEVEEFKNMNILKRIFINFPFFICKK